MKLATTPATTVALALATVGILAAGSLPAVADSSPSAATLAKAPVTVASHLAGPLTFAVGDGGKLYVGQSFSGALTLIKSGRPSVNLVSAPGVDIAAVSTRHSSVTWAQSVFNKDREVVSAVIKHRTKKGSIRQIANTLAYERRVNPDGKKKYGFRGLSPACTALIPQFLRPYTGRIDSHPYGSVTSRSATYVADAGANALLKIDHRGRVSTVAVLPSKTVRITAAAAAANKLNPCVVGHDYVLESVPTDVEIGPNGKLYVSTLPGGAEDGSMGANGSVYRVNPKNGAVNRVATGFAGATNIAITPTGKIYVAELFGDRVSSISRNGKVTRVARLTKPAGLEWARGYLYVSTNVFVDGSIVKLKIG